MTCEKLTVWKRPPCLQGGTFLSRISNTSELEWLAMTT